MWRRSFAPRTAGRASAILDGAAEGLGIRTAGRLDGWTAGRLDGWTAGRLDGWKMQGELPRVRTGCPQISQMKSRLFPEGAPPMLLPNLEKFVLNCLSIRCSSVTSGAPEPRRRNT